LTIVDTRMCRSGHELGPEDMLPDGRCRICERVRERRRANIKAGRHPREVLLRVSNAPLRERYLTVITTGVASPTQIARNLGWFCGGRSKKKPDTARLRRALGLLPSYTERDGGRVEYFVDELDYERAQAICFALYADPPAVGI
jgi:hypothetical protein